MPSHYNFQALDNFRDIGGYPTSSTRFVREGIVYRSASCDHISKSDIEALKNLFEIKIIFDLRSTSEERQK